MVLGTENITEYLIVIECEHGFNKDVDLIYTIVTVHVHVNGHTKPSAENIDVC